MIFLTVGTQYPFERLVRAVDEAVASGVIEEEIFGQIGPCPYKPQNFDFTHSLDSVRFDNYLAQSQAVVGHAGVGTITMALNNNKNLLVMPRLAEHGEHVNDHQLGLARKFEQAGHILVAYECSQLPEKLALLHSFEPTPRQSNPHDVAARVGSFLSQLQAKNL